MLKEIVEKLRKTANAPEVATEPTEPMSVEAREILAKFEVSAEIAANEGKGYITAMSFTKEDFTLTPNSKGFGFNDIVNKAKKEAYMEFVKTQGLNTYVIPTNMNPKEIACDVVVTWNDTPMETVMLTTKFQSDNSKPKSAFETYYESMAITPTEMKEVGELVKTDISKLTPEQVVELTAKLEKVDKPLLKKILLYYCDNMVDVTNKNTKLLLLNFKPLLSEIKEENKPTHSNQPHKRLR